MLHARQWMHLMELPLVPMNHPLIQLLLLQWDFHVSLKFLMLKYFQLLDPCFTPNINSLASISQIIFTSLTSLSPPSTVPQTTDVASSGGIKTQDGIDSLPYMDGLSIQQFQPSDHQVINQRRPCR